MKISELILKSLQNTASYNKHELAAPSVIIWPDEEQLWLKCFEVIQFKRKQMPLTKVA